MSYSLKRKKFINSNYLIRIFMKFIDYPKKIEYFEKKRRKFHLFLIELKKNLLMYLRINFNRISMNFFSFLGINR